MKGVATSFLLSTIQDKKDNWTNSSIRKNWMLSTNLIFSMKNQYLLWIRSSKILILWVNRMVLAIYTPQNQCIEAKIEKCHLRALHFSKSIRTRKDIKRIFISSLCVGSTGKVLRPESIFLNVNWGSMHSRIDWMPTWLDSMILNIKVQLQMMTLSNLAMTKMILTIIQILTQKNFRKRKTNIIIPNSERLCLCLCH